MNLNRCVLGAVATMIGAMAVGGCNLRGMEPPDGDAPADPTQPVAQQPSDPSSPPGASPGDRWARRHRRHGGARNGHPRHDGSRDRDPNRDHDDPSPQDPR